MKTSLSLLLFLCGLTTAVVRDHIYVNIRKNWTDAQSYCRQHYTDLSTIKSEEEQQIIIKLQGANISYSWIGLHKDINNITYFRWSDGDSQSFSKWLYGQPNNINNNQLCVSIYTNSEWFDTECYRKLPFYCHTAFVLIKEKMTWEEALEYCRIHHTDLASVTSERQLQLIKTERVISQTDSVDRPVWTGLRFLAGQWLWVNGKPLGQIELPVCPAQSSRCGARNTITDTWENRDCEEKLNFLCN